MWHLKKAQIQAILSLVGGFLLHLTLGTLYCFGNMNTYMTSYLRKHVPSQVICTNVDLGAGNHVSPSPFQSHVTYSDAIWILTLTISIQGVFMTSSGYLEDLLGVRPLILLGSAILTGGVLLTSLTIQHSLALTALTYGVMFGLGLALSYAPPLGVAMRWFPDKK